jgi:hypothetical protein
MEGILVVSLSLPVLVLILVPSQHTTHNTMLCSVGSAPKLNQSEARKRDNSSRTSIALNLEP